MQKITDMRVRVQTRGGGGAGDMNKSNRVHVRIQEFLSGRGGGVEVRRQENSLDNVFF